jgi:hypothetical protein
MGPLLVGLPSPPYTRRNAIIVETIGLRDGHLRVFLHGRWRDARLQPRPGDPEPYLRRMNRVHAAFVRTESSDPAPIEITPE